MLRMSRWHPPVIEFVIDAAISNGGAIEVCYGDPSVDRNGRARAQMFPEKRAEWNVYWTPSAPDSTVPRPEAVKLEAVFLEVGRAAPKSILLSGPSEAVQGVDFSVRAAALDSLGFPAVGFPDGARVRAIHESGRTESPVALTDPSADPCAREARLLLGESGMWWVELVPDPERGGVEARWAIPIHVDASGERASKRRLAFGDLHWHTNRSDGSRSPEEGYAYARDVSGLDFAARTDHDVHHVYNCMEEDGWKESETDVSRWDEPGRFAALLGWEYSWGRGHWIVLHRAASGPYRPVVDHASVRDLWAALVPGESVTILAHPAGGVTVPGSNWEDIDPRFVTASEMFSMHGNMESRNVPHQSGNPALGVENSRIPVATIQEALSRGHVFAFVGSTDNHTATPGNPVRHARRDISASTGLCAAWVDSLTREGVFDAIARGEVYATTGPRIRVEDEIEDGVFSGLVAGAADLASVDVIGVRRGGEPPFEIVHSIAPKGRLARFSWSIPDTLRSSLVAVYLRVTQSDTEMAWSSPRSVSSTTKGESP
jgi:hypothetical protein